MQQKITNSIFTVSSQIDFIQYKFDQYQYFIRENRFKNAFNHHKLCEIALKT